MTRQCHIIMLAVMLVDIPPLLGKSQSEVTVIAVRCLSRKREILFLGWQKCSIDFKTEVHL